MLSTQKVCAIDFGFLCQKPLVPLLWEQYALLGTVRCHLSYRRASSPSSCWGFFQLALQLFAGINWSFPQSDFPAVQLFFWSGSCLKAECFRKHSTAAPCHKIKDRDCTLHAWPEITSTMRDQEQGEHVWFEQLAGDHSAVRTGFTAQLKVGRIKFAAQLPLPTLGNLQGRQDLDCC